MSSTNQVRTIIAVDLDYFYAQCEEVRDPSFKGKPVVVCVFSHRTADSGAVSTANYIAREMGVRSGMPIVLAKKMLAGRPDSKFLPMDAEFYDAESERVMTILRSFSPVFEQSSIDEAYLDVSQETKGNFEAAEQIGRKIKLSILQATQLTCSVGIGPNKLMAKMAVDFKKPDGFTVVTPDKVSSFLSELPVGKLFGIGPKTEKKMESLGINTIADLSKADAVILSREFGVNLGPELRDMARGIDEAPVRERETEQLSRIVTLKQDAEKFDFQEVMLPLASDLARRLESMNYSCKSIGIIAITTELKTKSRVRTLEEPTSNESEIYSVACSLFSSFFEERETDQEGRGLKVRRVGIRLSNLSKKSEQSTDLAKNLTLSDFMS